MVTFKCSAPDKVKITDVKPFQGNLKKRTSQDIDELTRSIINEGLLMPFAVWQHEGNNYLLDGHGRLEALIRASLTDTSILEQEFPCIYITADTEEDARKALLQITSSYGKISKKGVVEFTATIPDYKAPVLDVTHKHIHKRKVSENANLTKVIRIAVSPNQYDQVLDILKKVDYIRIL